MSHYRRSIFPPYETRRWKADVESRRGETIEERIRTISCKSLRRREKETLERKPHVPQKERIKDMLAFQEQVLQEAVQRKKNMTMILVNGFHIKGTIKGYDIYSILVEVDGKQQLVYKHAISTIRL